MSEKRDFETFDRDKLNINEEIQGETVEDRSGHKIDQTDDQFLDMTKDEVKGKNQIEKKLVEELDNIVDQGATLERQEEVTKLHREWLTYSWPNYTEEKHIEIINMYDADDRYKAYFGEERTKALVAAVKHVIQ
ncbi:TipAS antibiotic-recognition domain-containing protein [Mammaliicoccus sciuri]|uniref:TipAS antibiotic-recognition domain-containing protein n=2 Tax=Mammaliicoccus sciuri TaxID=1296 RepID=UPI002B264107|nr:TipAS antibiotic-recognition domain-containing protein [Mammaliicoccus sciuri]WQK71860.1 TipAS antibiotic-recognition domain-containing protein [Mammaliicoccus sciuri]